MDAIWWQIFDLLGTTAFAVSGVFAAISRRMDLFGIFVLSAATAVGGGVIRDVLAGRIPSVLRKEVYATASLLGSIFLYGAVIPFEVPLEVGAIVAFSVTVAIRLVAIRLHLNIPRIRRAHHRRA